MIGRSVSHYKITSKIGEGGMGEVYRATDSKLNRDVALKVLPEAFAYDAQRMGRFEREAQVLASLNHPQIAGIYGLEEDNGTKALVMELVEGEDLSDRIARGPIPVDEALPIALQIAEALEDAHEKVIIHRDLKPANVKVTPEGKVKVLDFGLAKALEEERTQDEISNSPTLTMEATQAGIILGTAAYMSPEQVRGTTVDKRVDIWAFGVVLYEMLTGQRMFGGETVSDSLAKVLQAPLTLSKLPETTPPAIRRLLNRCLERDSKHRLRDIGDARIEIEEVLGRPEEQVSIGDTVPSATHRWKVTALAGTVTLLAGLIIGWLAWKDGPPPEKPYRRFAVATGDVVTPDISPDGKHVAYLVMRRGHSYTLTVQDLDSDTPHEVVELPWSPGSWTSLAWSPGSDSIVFNVRDELTKLSLKSGATVTLCKLESGRVWGIAWSPEGEVIVLSSGSFPNARLYEIPSGGGSPRLLSEGDPSEQLKGEYGPHFLPSQDGRRVLLYTAVIEDDDNIMLWDLDADERRQLVAGFRSEYSPTGHVLYEREDGLWAMPFSLDSLTVAGEPFLVRRGVNFPSVAGDGTLVYREPPDTGQQQLVWKSRQGITLGVIGQPQERIWGPRISPEGKRVIVHAVDNDNQDIWIHDTARSVKTRLTSDPAAENRAIWSPDARHIIYSSTRNGNYDVFVRAADGSGEERCLYEMPGSQWAMDWSADGKYLALTNLVSDELRRVLYVRDPLGGEAGEPAPLLRSEFNEWDPAFSPDGKYVAYSSDESGRQEVFVQRFPGLGNKVQVSINGGSRPRWRSDGQEMYFVRENSLVSVPVSIGPEFTVGDPEVLFEHSYLSHDGGQQYDVSADGQKFVVIEPVDQGDQATIRLVENWFAEFQNRE